MRPRVLLQVAMLCVLCLSGCRDQTPGAHRAGPPPVATATDTAAPKAPGRTPEQIVRDPRSVLAGAQVRPTAEGLRVTSRWRVRSDRGTTWQAITTSDDGFATATYERWTPEGYYGGTPPHERPDPPWAGDLHAWPLPSLVEDKTEQTTAYALGGDGATFFPFEKTVRSTDRGRTRTTFDVARVDGEWAYLNGGVVLGDGRLLVLLGNWSGDRPRRPSNVHHGLWVSEGDDWSSFTPWQPTFSPPLEPTADDWHPLPSLEGSAGAGGSVIWSVSYNGLLYVSTDEGQTFTAIPAR